MKYMFPAHRVSGVPRYYDDQKRDTGRLVLPSAGDVTAFFKSKVLVRRSVT
jgi:hypothetical protein